MEGKKESSGAFGKIIKMVVLITLMFTTAVLLVIAKFNDVNVFDKAKEVTSSLPFVGDTEQKKLTGIDEGILEDRVVNLASRNKRKRSRSISTSKNNLMLQQMNIKKYYSLSRNGY